VTRNLDALEAALAVARQRLAERRSAAEATGRRPLRRLIAIARVLRHGAPFPGLAARPAVDAQTEIWRRHALDLEAELETLRHEAAGAGNAARVRNQALRAAQAANKRLAMALARVDEERQRLADSTAAAPDPETTTDYAAWIGAVQPSSEALRVMRDMGVAQIDGPTFSIVTPVYKVPLGVLRETIASVRRQTYGRWELCIAHADAADHRARRFLRAAAEEDPRIRLVELAENKGISKNSNAALELVTGDFVVLLDHDDIMVDHALSTFARALAERPEIDVLYSDKDLTDARGVERINPLFKPAWSPETMLTANYLTHLNAMRTSLVRAVGGWRPEMDGAQDWDLFMRLTERTTNIEAVRDVLYRWRMIKSSVAGGGIAAKPYALAAQVRTLEGAFRRRGLDVTYAPEDDGPTLRPTWNTQPARISVIVLPIRDDGSIAAAETTAARCPESVFEILLPTAEDAFLTDERMRIVAVERDATAAQRLSAALAQSAGTVTVVIDAGTWPPESETWVEDLVGPLMIPGVAMVGGKVLDSQGARIASAGIVFHADGSETDLFRDGQRTQHGVIGSAHWIRNVSAVGGGLFAVETETARKIGFADERDHPRADIDFCLRLVCTGRRIVYTPFVESRQMAVPALSEARGEQSHGRNFVASIWPDGDPHFHPALISDGAVQRFRLPAGHRRTPHDYGAEADALVRVCDAASTAIAAARNPRRAAVPWRTATWIVPDFRYAYYGGVATILRFAAYLARRHGVVSTFAATGITPADVLEQRIVAAFPDLAGSRFVRVESTEAVAALPPADAGIATLWTTAYYLLHADTTKQYYFVQDNEPQFYPAGSTSALVEATYRFGFRAICNTVTLADVARAYGGDAVYFTPAIDPAIFHARGRSGASQRRRLFAYARPGHARNGFELLARALHIVKDELGDRVDIVTAGAPWSTAAYGLDGVMANLGLLGYKSTGDLYRSCDAGAVLMMTSHPSYLPMELMACGAAVVTNVNPRTAWLLRDEHNAFLAETTASSFAERIITALTDDVARARIAGTARDIVASQHADWDAEWDRLTAQLWNATV
jgi:glycosyltransferase involved in cell wall biosynthesis/GT2 family glycosyltransferase